MIYHILWLGFGNCRVLIRTQLMSIFILFSPQYPNPWSLKIQNSPQKSICIISKVSKYKSWGSSSGLPVLVFFIGPELKWYFFCLCRWIKKMEKYSGSSHQLKKASHNFRGAFQGNLLNGYPDSKNACF